MTYTIEKDGGALVVSVQGHLNINTTPVLEAAIKEQLGDVDDLTIDLAGVDYISSMGLRLLLNLQKRMFKQGSMRVINVNAPVMQLFEDTGFAQILTVQ